MRKIFKNNKVVLVSIWITGFAITFGAGVQAQTKPAPRYNILWLVAEDISPYLPSYGDSTAKTPNLDRLVREGVRFTNVFSVSGVCAPSRSCLITGMYPTSIGTNNMRTLNPYPNIGLPKYSVVLPPEVKMLSELMRRAGYYCTNNNKQDYQFVAPLSGWNESSLKAHWRNRPPGKPFFSVVNFEVTHESQIWARKNDPLLVDPAKVKLPPYYPESPIIRRDLARMYSNIMEMDEEVGEKLKELEENGLLDSTIIVWYTDNGGPIPRGKREIYDTGLHVPMIIRYPNKKFAGTVNADLVSFVDFAPTTLSLANIKIPSYLQGQAFAGASKAVSPRKYIYAARDRMDSEYDMVRAVRDERFKYIKNFQPEKPYIQNIAYRKQMDLMNELLRFEKEGKLEGVQQLWFRKTKDKEELFDTQNDPFELKNLATDPFYASKLKELRGALEKWMVHTKDKGFITEKDWVASIWPNMIQPVTQKPRLKSVAGLITLTSQTPGASVSYKMLNETSNVRPGEWELYSGPVRMNKGQKIIAVAERIGYKSSDQIEFTYNN
ncbi:sulfatase [Daejeonella sp.]|uniref:sulfatase family protein n=1 Tax=Daejeonella sp. TaxID=2805397 RepID=UPI0030C0A9FE